MLACMLAMKRLHAPSSPPPATHPRNPAQQLAGAHLILLVALGVVQDVLVGVDGCCLVYTRETGAKVRGR